MHNIIVVDDNVLAVEGIHRNVDWAALDARITRQAYDAAGALAALDEDTDLVISDIRMPGMDGIEMSRLILERQPAAKIILISAYDDFELAQRAIRLGVFDYVEKPLDYAYLQTVVQKALADIDSERRVLEQLRQSLPALRDSFFWELLHTGEDEARYTLARDAQILDMALNHPWYGCAVVAIENSAEAKEALGIERYHTVQLALAGAIDEALGDFDLVHRVQGVNRIVVVVGGAAADASAFAQRLNDCFEAVLQARRGGMTVNVGIGPVVDSLWALSRSYAGAQKTLEYRFFFPQKSLFDTRDVTNPGRSGVLFDQSLIDHIAEAVCQNDTGAVEAAVDTLTRQFLGRYTNRIGLYTALGLATYRLLDLMNDMGLPEDGPQLEILEMYNQVAEFSTAEQARDWLLEVCRRVMEQLDQSLASHHGRMSRQVYDYISANYGDTTLSLGAIASAVNISPAHLSAVFKKINNENISDVITKVRMTAAKNLLERSSASIREISERTGFSNQYYFSVSFKKNTGMTPTEYRAAQQKDRQPPEAETGA